MVRCWLLMCCVGLAAACTNSSGGSDDAGLDAGPHDVVRADASVTRDASVTDAAVTADASVPDASMTPDAAVTADAAVELPDAAVELPDAAVVVDAAAPPDAACAAPAADRSGTQVLVDGALTARADRIAGEDCARTWQLSSTAPLRDNQPMNPRIVIENADAPVLHSGNDLLDALYALALEEVRQNSVAAISDGAFSNGQPITCPAGGCFQTGRLWTYAWTRDTAYSVDLGLARADPTRSRNTLEFKLSTRRDGTEEQVVQDTGTGGSWPVSSDRVVWALGAWEVLQHLDGAERTAFAERAFTALKNTVELDRLVVFDARSGLYRGETSFLDWREQTYPPWMAQDVVHIGMSTALSTNVLHLRALEVTAALATLTSRPLESARYQGFADALRTRIRSTFTLPDGTLSAFITTTLDGAPVQRWDLLGHSLAILAGVADETQARTLLSTYPHLERGVPVIFPQQKATPIYHNRSTWPFVTAYWARAGRAGGNDAVVDHALRSLLRGAALNLSNMENWEVVTGEAFHADGLYSGPVVNSQRQLWSVAAFLSVVEQVLVGTEYGPLGMRVLPFIPIATRNALLGGTNEVVLRNLSWRGRHITVRIHLPAVDASTDGVLRAASVLLNGAPVAPDAWQEAAMAAENVWDVTLIRAPSTASIRTIADVTDYRMIFGPLPPVITAVATEANGLRVSWDPNTEAASDVTFAIYRDGVLLAENVAGSARSYLDVSAMPAAQSHCYTVEATFPVSGNHSQHASPWCWWGVSTGRIRSIPADQFTWMGGTPSSSHGRFHHDDWGGPLDSVQSPSFTAAVTAPHLVHAVFGNGGGITTGITAGHKRLRVLRTDNGAEVASGPLLMPHLGNWDRWADSSYVRADLEVGVGYRVVVDAGAQSINMSNLQHHALYTGGPGGTAPANFVNLSELKVLSLAGPP